MNHTCLFANSHSVREVSVRESHPLVPGRKNIPSMNHFTKTFPRAPVQREHKYWPKSDIIANTCTAGVDAGNSQVQKIFSGFMPMSLRRVQCVTTFKICATTFMSGIITRLSFTQYTGYLIMSRLIITKKQVSGVVWDRWLQLQGNLLFSVFWISAGNL